MLGVREFCTDYCSKEGKRTREELEECINKCVSDVLGDR